jgi:hypothetical protein
MERGIFTGRGPGVPVGFGRVNGGGERGRQKEGRPDEGRPGSGPDRVHDDVRYHGGRAMSSADLIAR